MAAFAVNEMRTENRLPRINYGKVVVFKEAVPYFGEPCNSLPPLPRYTVYGDGRRRWGEDEEMNRLGFSSANDGFPTFKYRNNYDSCHPVSEDPEYLNYEGYMYPKPMHQDITVLRCSVTNTSRQVPRDPKCEMFPRNDTHRVRDSRRVLGEATRKAIEENVTNLYRNTRYNTQFLDTSRLMLDKAERDVRFHLDNPGSTEISTCSRIYNHPDPCHYCWCGGYNEGILLNPSHLDFKRYGSTKMQLANQDGSAEVPFSPKNKHDDVHEVQCNMGLWEQMRQRECFENSCGVCCGKIENIGDVEKSTKSAGDNTGVEDEVNKTDTDKAESAEFGPWSEDAKKGDNLDRQLLSNDIYQSRLLSKDHCELTQNEYATECENRHYYLNLRKHSLEPWKSLCRVKMAEMNRSVPTNSPDAQQQQQQRALETKTMLLPPIVSQNRRNTWTFRDEHNLRIPCIANVLGSSHKSDVHKRFHFEHPEPIPDLRDNMKNARRVRFYGFSSAVFR